MQRVQYQPTRTKQQPPLVHLFTKICRAALVFIRRDAQKPPLQPTYGPFRVIDRKEIVFCCGTQQSARRSLSTGTNLHTLHTHLNHSQNTPRITHKRLCSQHPLINIPQSHHLQSFVPGQDVEFSGMIVSFSLIHSFNFTRSLCNSLEGELCSVSLYYLFVRS